MFCLQDFIYLLQSESEHKQWERGEGEAGILVSGDPDNGVDARTLRSGPDPKSDA